MEFWLGRLSPPTAVTNRYHFNRFMRWLRGNGGEFSHFTPDELVEFQIEASGRERYRILDVVQSYVNTVKGRHGTKVKVYSTIRSFFMHNRAELPRDGSFHIRGDKPKVVGNLKPEEIRQIILSSNECYRAIFLCMFQGAIDRESFIWWNNYGWPKLKEALKGDSEVIRIDLPGRKNARNLRPYYTFIGPDAIDALRKWIPLRAKEASAIFTDQLGKPVSSNAVKQYWDRHLRRLGLVKRVHTGKGRGGGVRYGKNPHEMRDVFRSLWEKSSAKPSVAEFLMGHEVDPLEYNKAFKDEGWVRREYLKALPYIQIISSGRPFGQVEEDELDKLRAQVRRLEQAGEKVRKLEALLEDPEVYDAFVETLQKLKERKHK